MRKTRNHVGKNKIKYKIRGGAYCLILIGLHSPGLAWAEESKLNIYDSVNNTVSQSGSSTTVYAYSYSNDANNLLTVTTVHGNTVKVNMKTGVYEVTASGISAETIVNEKPQASLGDKGGQSKT